MTVLKVLIEPLLALPDESARRALLETFATTLTDAEASALADALKAQADHYLRAELATSFQFAHLLLYWGELTHNPFHRALGLRAEANALSIGQGHYREALEIYNEAAGIYRTHGRTLDEAKAQIGKVWPLAGLGQYDEALRCGEWIAGVLEEHGEWHQLAGIITNMATIYGRLDNDVKALELFDKAHSIYKNIDAFEVCWVEENRAEILRNLGRFSESIQASSSAQKTLEDAGQVAEAAHAQQSTAITYFVLGRINEAVMLLDQVRSTYEKSQRLDDIAVVELLLSDFQLQQRRFNEAQRSCIDARKHFFDRGSQYEVAQTYLNEAIAHIGLKQLNDALTALGKARHLFEVENNIVWMATTDLEMARTLCRQSQFENPLHIARACEETFRLRQLPLKSAQAKLVAAQAALALGQESLAEKLAREVLELADDKAIPWLIYAARAALGALAAQRGNHAEALTEYDHAITALEQLRSRLMVEFRAGFVEDKQTAYEEAANLALILHQPARALDYAERAKSRALLDLLAYRLDLSVQPRHPDDETLVAELTRLRSERDQQVRRMEAAAKETRQQAEADQRHVLGLEKQITERWHTLLIRNADYAKDMALWQVRTEPPQSLLPAGTALLEYFAIGPDLIAFVATQHGVQAQHIAGGMAQAQRLLRNLWLNFRTVPGAGPQHLNTLAANAREVLGQLHALLIAPVQAALAAHPHWVVVSHGPLHYLPFHALHNKADGVYLTEQREISYAPSASVLKYCQRDLSTPLPLREGSHPMRGEGSVGSIACFGHSCHGRLPLAVAEAQQVAQLMGPALGSTAFTEAEATLANLKNSASQCDVLHLATHGDFRADNPLFSGLSFEDGTLTTLDVFGLRLRASLVTLSACQTGRTVLSGGDELLGLMRALLSAGASSLLLSLWRVADDSTLGWMQAFYSALKAGQTKSAAVQTANGQSLKAHAHPYFWAPFVLVGDFGRL